MTVSFLPAIPTSWQKIIGAHPQLQRLDAFLQTQEDKTVYPPRDNIFAALSLTSPDQVKVVILGQDPYHGPGQAHGLSFSVQDGVKLPPSLRNIYKELELEFQQPMPKNGNLSAWAQQGVLLLNATLTVEAEKAGSHQKRGWEEFTDDVIAGISRDHDHIVFMLWGSYAQKKAAMIDRQKHLVLEAPHPSPLSAHRGFLGCGHFIKANEYLEQTGQKPISWMPAST